MLAKVFYFLEDVDGNSDLLKDLHMLNDISPPSMQNGDDRSNYKNDNLKILRLQRLFHINPLLEEKPQKIPDLDYSNFILQ
ncbi:hypothetical protein ABEB36_008753 [Hypothenemus hampei]|uniref:Uncharacterized protein n=1 Tax=Hypothenemus hampei TaxID=57062 RepID=A0ABD1EN22_HYPHA